MHSNPAPKSVNIMIGTHIGLGMCCVLGTGGV